MDSIFHQMIHFTQNVGNMDHYVLYGPVHFSKNWGGPYSKSFPDDEIVCVIRTTPISPKLQWIAANQVCNYVKNKT